MKRAEPHIEDKLLELAYGEVPPAEREALHAHLKGCAACAQALGSIQSVRQAMSTLPIEAPSDSGLDSLLAYAEQTARRAASGPEPRSGWRRWWAPALGLGSALVIVGLVSLRGSVAPSTNLFRTPPRPPAAVTEPRPTPPTVLAKAGPAGGKEERLDVRKASKDGKAKAPVRAGVEAPEVVARAEVKELQQAGEKKDSDESSGSDVLSAPPSSQAHQLVADDTTRRTHAAPEESKPVAAVEPRRQEEVAAAGAPSSKSPESALAAANSAIAEGRWEAAVASLRVAIEQSRDPVEKDRLLDSLCGALEHLGRDCEALERQYATSPWATQRASVRAARKSEPANELPASLH